jgi:hypothetical protein
MNGYKSPMYNVFFTKSVLEQVGTLPEFIQKKLAVLIDDLRENGPIRTEWLNFSKPGKDEFHCHLAHNWVACWRCENKSIIIEVLYAGSRENVPY